MKHAHTPSQQLVRAMGLANFAFHAVGKARKYTNEPYIVHCQEVCAILNNYKCKPDVVIAGMLHDILEDTKVPKSLLAVTFGEQVAQLVWEVTDVSRPSDGNRAIRKAIDAQHLSKASSDGKDIKLADVISNCWDIANHDHKFAKVYLAEVRLLLPQLQNCTTPSLWENANEVVDAANDFIMLISEE